MGLFPNCVSADAWHLASFSLFLHEIKYEYEGLVCNPIACGGLELGIGGLSTLFLISSALIVARLLP